MKVNNWHEIQKIMIKKPEAKMIRVNCKAYFAQNKDVE